jgi:hypothetical protein
MTDIYAPPPQLEPLFKETARLLAYHGQCMIEIKIDAGPSGVQVIVYDYRRYQEVRA